MRTTKVVSDSLYYLVISVADEEEDDDDDNALLTDITEAMYEPHLSFFLAFFCLTNDNGMSSL